MSDEEKAQELISIFVCDKDRNIEDFLNEKATLFEKLGKSRTFLIFDGESEYELEILAYSTQTVEVGQYFFIQKWVELTSDYSLFLTKYDLRAPEATYI